MVGKYNKALGYTLRMRSLVRRVSIILTSSVVDTWNGRRRGRFAICCFPLGKTSQVWCRDRKGNYYDTKERTRLLYFLTSTADVSISLPLIPHHLQFFNPTKTFHQWPFAFSMSLMPCHVLIFLPMQLVFSLPPEQPFYHIYPQKTWIIVFNRKLVKFG